MGRSGMMFQSILGTEKLDVLDPEQLVMPKFFYDLNLDQVVQDIMEEQKLYDLRRYYFYPVELKDISYRLEVLKDLEQEDTLQSVTDFAIGIRKAKEYLGYIKDAEYIVQKRKWKLDAADSYIGSILKLKQSLEEGGITSEGLRSFREWLKHYTMDEEFLRLKEDTEKLIAKFDEMTFHLQLKRDRIIIEPGYLEEDYCKQLQDTFREESEDKHFYQKNPFGTPSLSVLEGTILEVLGRYYSQTFLDLAEYDKKHQSFICRTILDFESESQFYLAFIRYRKRMEELGFHFCYPQVKDQGTFRITEGYDLALAKKNADIKKPVVFNDCYLNEGERFFVITGPNQGGKTTFARALGQIVFFSSIGLMAPCRTATLPFFRGIYTHFAAEESLDTGAGKLKEELLRLKEMLPGVSRHSFIIINEIFTSATSYDAYIMGKRVINRFIEMDCLGVYVTHIHELTKEDDRIVSLVAALLSEDSQIRTYRIERRPADGRSYANHIVEKHGMTYLEIKERLRR